MTQPTLWDGEASRLAKAASKLLDRLKQGPATNIELVPICGIRASARVHDLRQAGHNIEAKRLIGGTWLYTLKNV